MGAINKQTNKYEYPKIAEKPNKFMCPYSKKEISKFSCPDCGSDVQLKKGAILAHHFAHYKSDNPCKYYEHPGESQIHKDAKLALKTVLESGEGVHLFRTCNSCKKTINTSDVSILNETVTLEYPFMYNNSRKIADIACLDGECIKHIFEICHKHKTSENDRPEPWSEINAEELLTNINNQTSDSPIHIECIRYEICDECKLRKTVEQEQIRLRQEEYADACRIRQEKIENDNKKWLENHKEQERLRAISDQQILEARRRREEEERLKQEEIDKNFNEYKNQRITELETLKKSIYDRIKRCSKCKISRCSKCVAKVSAIYLNERQPIIKKWYDINCKFVEVNKGVNNTNPMNAEENKGSPKASVGRPLFQQKVSCSTQFQQKVMDTLNEIEKRKTPTTTPENPQFSES